MEPASARRVLADALRRYIRFPAVDVSVTQPSTSIYLAGGPGGVATYSPNEHLAAFVNRVQLPASIDLHRVGLDRSGQHLGTYNLANMSDGGPTLEPGDTITLTDKPISVEVQGDVKQPGTTYLYDGQHIGDAVAQMGGFNDDAARGIIELRRAGKTQSVTSETTVQQGDVIDIAPARHVSVGGMVAKPGDVAMVSGNSLIAALYDAGGPLQNADLGRVTLLHNGAQTTYDVTAVSKGVIAQNPQVADGDVIFVPKGRRLDLGPIFGAVSALRYFIVP
jgi:protein involved in polysaccharide export with SLBB domain